MRPKTNRMKHYLDAVYQGKNEWWRYVLGVLVILGVGLVIGAIVTAIVGLLFLLLSHPNPAIFSDSKLFERALLDLFEQPTVPGFIGQNLQFVVLMAGIAIAVKLIHRRPFRSLISPGATLSGRRFLTGFGLWFGMMGVLVGISAIGAPGEFVLTFEPVKWLGLLVAVLIFTPIQIGAEELFCRGYLTQGLGLLTRNRLLLISIPSMLFAAAHFTNPEMGRGAVWMGLNYWAFGIFLATITLRDNRLELALGVHAANNMFIFLIVNSTDSALKTPAIWTVNTTDDPRSSLLSLLLQAGLFYWLIFGRKKPRQVAGAGSSD
jgi:uncharacterized protein